MCHCASLPRGCAKRGASARAGGIGKGPEPMNEVFAATEQARSPASAAAARAPIDFAHLRRYTLNDAVLEKEILELFAAQLPVTIADLRAAGDPVKWKRAAHTLKGSARAVGAGELAELAASAEQAAASADPAARRAIVESIDAAAAGVAAYIAAL